MISFLSVFPPYRGGIAKFSDSLYRQLERQTDILPYNFKKLYPSLLFPGSSQTVDESSQMYAEEIFHPYQPFNWKKAADRLMDDNPDYLLYSYWHPFFAPGLRKVLTRCKKKKPALHTAGIAHNIMPHEYFPFKKYLTEKLFDATDITIVLSEQTESDFANLDTSSECQKLFHPIYKLNKPEKSARELRNNYGFKEDDHIVLFLGLVRDYKGVDLLIEAFNSIHRDRKNFKPFIVGEFYTNKANLLGQIDDQFRDLYTIKDEFVSEKTMAEILSLSDLLVLPYKKASQSGVLANAIYFNLPTLVSDQPGLSEHLIHRHNGMIFRPGDAQDLRNKILTYFDEDLQKKLSNNLEPLKKDLSWEKFSGELLQTIKSL